MYRWMVGRLREVWSEGFVSSVEGPSRTRTRSKQVDPSAMGDFHRPPCPRCPTEISSVHLRKDRNSHFEVTKPKLLVAHLKPFRRSTKPSRPQVQSQGFPSSLILVDVRDLKTCGDTRVTLFSDKSSTAREVWELKVSGSIDLILFFRRLSLWRLTSPPSMNCFRTSIRFSATWSSLRMSGLPNHFLSISVSRFWFKLRFVSFWKEAKAPSEIAVTPAPSILSRVMEARLSLRNTVEFISPTSRRLSTRVEKPGAKSGR